MRKLFFPFPILLLSTLASFVFILNNDFLGDDSVRIINNPKIYSFLYALVGDLSDRPLLSLSLWLDVTLFGPNPVFFRLENILLHALVSWQLFKFLYLHTKEESGQYFALVAATLFALHPLHNQVINITIQRGVILAALFALLSLRHFKLYQESNSNKNFAYSFLFLVLGMLAKPIVFCLPLLYLYADFVHQKSLKKTALYCLVWLLPLGYYFLGQKNVQLLSLPAWQYFLTQMQAWFLYYRLILVPYGMSYLYDFIPPSTPWIHVGWVLLLLHISFFVLIYKWLTDRWAKLFFIGFYLTLLPESSFFAINHLAFDHRTYLPMVFLFLALGTELSLKEIWKNISYSKFVGLLIFSFFILNQVRNFQIKPAANFVLHTLENSTSDHYMNTRGALSLINQGKLIEMKDIMEYYRQNFSHLNDYRILLMIYDCYAQSCQPKSMFQTVAPHLKNPIASIHVRNWVNTHIVNQTVENPHTLEDLQFLADMLSSQMIYFMKLPEGFMDLIVFYRNLSRNLLASPKVAPEMKQTLTTINNKYFAN